MLNAVGHSGKQIHHDQRISSYIDTEKYIRGMANAGFRTVHTLTESGKNQQQIL